MSKYRYIGLPNILTISRTTELSKVSTTGPTNNLDIPMAFLYGYSELSKDFSQFRILLKTNYVNRGKLP